MLNMCRTSYIPIRCTQCSSNFDQLKFIQVCSVAHHLFLVIVVACFKMLATTVVVPNASMPGPTASVHIKQALPVALARAIDLTPFEANDLTGPVVVLATAVITGPAVVLATAFAFITGPVAVLATAFALAAFGPVVLATAFG